MSDLSLFASVVFLSAVFSTVVGFGTLTIVLPIASLFVDLRSAIGIMTVVALFLVLAKAWAFRTEIDYAVGWHLGVPAVIGAAIGAYQLGITDTYWVKKALGILVLAFVLASLTGFIDRIRIGRRMSWFWALAYGLSTGFLGVGEMISAPLLLSLGLKKGRFVGTFSFISILTLPVKILLYWRAGILDPSQAPTILMLSICAVLGVAAGRRLLAVVPVIVFERLAMGTLLLMSLMLIRG